MDGFQAEVERQDVRLARACLLVAKDERPGVDVEACLATFDAWAARVRERPEGEPFPDALRRVLAREEGFRGNAADYYDPDNSLLDAVLARRTGTPIALSVVYLEVARRLGQPLVGVGMPAHFLVRHEGTILDPFHGGIAVTEADCDHLLQRLTGGRLRLEPPMLEPTPDRDILARLLTNLKAIHARAGDVDRALRVEERLLQLNPYAFEEYRDRGLLRRAAGDAEGARRDFLRYLRAMPRAPDASRVRALLARDA